MLRCDVSDPKAQVTWYADGTEIHEQKGLDIQSQGSIRTLVVQSAELSHTGVYSCKTTDDGIEFHVEVKGETKILVFSVFTN